MNHYQIITKLIGQVSPIGDASKDDERLANLIQHCELIELLMEDVQYVANHKNSYESSVKMLGDYADKFLKTLLENYYEK